MLARSGWNDDYFVLVERRRVSLLKMLLHRPDACARDGVEEKSHPKGISDLLFLFSSP